MKVQPERVGQHDFRELTDAIAALWSDGGPWRFLDDLVAGH